MRPWTEKQPPRCVPYPLAPLAQDISAGQGQPEGFWYLLHLALIPCSREGPSLCWNCVELQPDLLSPPTFLAITQAQGRALSCKNPSYNRSGSFYFASLMSKATTLS